MKSPNLVSLDNDDIDLLLHLLKKEAGEVTCSIRTMNWTDEEKAKRIFACMTLAETLEAAKT